MSMVCRLNRFGDFLVRLVRIQWFGLILVVGLFSLLTVDIVLTQDYKQEKEFQKTLIAQKIQSQLVASLEEHMAALVSISVVYQNFVDITNYDFQQYGYSITSHLNGFNRLMFVDSNYVIRHIYPMSPQNRGLIGVSLIKNRQLVNTLQQSRQLNKITPSQLIPFLDQNKALLAALPITREDSNFLGYALGEISLQKIWQPISEAPYTSHYQLELTDPAGTRFFNTSDLTWKQSAQLTHLPFQIGGQQWALIVQPAYPNHGLLVTRLLWWGGGLAVLSAILTLIVRINRHKVAFGEARTQFETIFDASPDGILLLSNDLTIRLSNPTIQMWTNQSAAQLQGKSFFDVFACRCPHLSKCNEVAHLLCTGQQFKEELPETLELNIKNRSEHAPARLRFNAARIGHHMDQESKGGFICMLGDITASKELEREKETYVATLTHDLKTPLLAQEMVLDSLLSGSAGEVNATQQRLLNASKQSVQDLLDMVNDSLLFYKIESSRLSIQKHPHSLSGLIESAIETLQPLAESRGLSFEIESSAGLPDAMVDAVQLKRVFHNILANAVSYAQKDSIIRIMLYVEPEERLIVQIKNEGKGILSEELPRIFDKYYSLSRKFKQIGTGLGLYISRRIVELHGGKIWATSELNQETSFYIALPYPQHISGSLPQKTAALL